MTPIWQTPVTVEAMAAMCADTAVSHLGIEFLELGPDFLRARVPVDPRTHQPLQGAQRNGALRVGEMEQDAFIAWGT